MERNQSIRAGLEADARLGASHHAHRIVPSAEGWERDGIAARLIGLRDRLAEEGNERATRSPFVLAQRAASEGPRWTRAVEGRPGRRSREGKFPYTKLVR